MRWFKPECLFSLLERKGLAKFNPSSAQDLGTCMGKQLGGFVFSFFLDTAVFFAVFAEVSI